MSTRNQVIAKNSHSRVIHWRHRFGSCFDIRTRRPNQLLLKIVTSIVCMGESNIQSLPPNLRAVEQDIAATLQDAHHLSISGNAQIIGLDTLEKFVSFNALHVSPNRPDSLYMHLRSSNTLAPSTKVLSSGSTSSLEFPSLNFSPFSSCNPSHEGDHFKPRFAKVIGAFHPPLNYRSTIWRIYCGLLRSSKKNCYNCLIRVFLGNRGLVRNRNLRNRSMLVFAL
ncbi:hypothetical protein JOM56_014247 [Amanita muscaria]